MFLKQVLVGDETQDVSIDVIRLFVLQPVRGFREKYQVTLLLPFYV